MKKTFFVLLMTIAFATNVNAQDRNLFNHLSVGPSIGVLDGFGFEVATPIGNYVNLRAGYSILPFNMTFDGAKVYKWVDGKSEYKGDADVKATLKNSAVKFLFDVHPFLQSSFRFTVGAYIGNSRLISAVNDEYNEEYNGCFIKLGDKRFGFEDGYAHAHIKVNNFRPYVGIGFGRAVSAKSKSAFNFDLGVQFWGTPKVYGYDIVEGSYQQLKDEDIDDAEGKKALKTLSKISVSPVLSVKYMFNIF